MPVNVFFNVPPITFLLHDYYTLPVMFMKYNVEVERKLEPHIREVMSKMRDYLTAMSYCWWRQCHS